MWVVSWIQQFSRSSRRSFSAGKRSLSSTTCSRSRGSNVRLSLDVLFIDAFLLLFPSPRDARGRRSGFFGTSGKGAVPPFFFSRAFRYPAPFPRRRRQHRVAPE